MTANVFHDRRHAGRVLAQALGVYANRSDVTVLALPRGGVPVGFEVACALAAPLDVFIVRKLGVPWYEEYAMGVLASGGVRVLNEAMIRQLGIGDSTVEEVTRAEQQELERRERLYRGTRPPPDVRGRRVILVDDGLATGSNHGGCRTGAENPGPAAHRRRRADRCSADLRHAARRG